MKKLIAVTRVSTKEQGKTKNGLEAQAEAIRQFAHYNGYTVVEVIQEVVSGAASIDQRPGLMAAIAKAAKCKDTYIVVNKLDRLSRDAEYIMGFVKRQPRFIVTDLGESVSPFMLHIYAAVAEQERVAIGQRTSAALQAKKARGQVLGAKADVIARARTAGNTARAANADEFATKLKANVSRMLASGMSFRQIADELNCSGIKTSRKGVWYHTSVKNMVERFNKEAA